MRDMMRNTLPETFCPLHIRLVLACIMLCPAIADACFAEQPKPRVVVLTDVSTWETDDSESLVRLLVHADLLEIEGLVFTTGWSLDKTRDDFVDLIHVAVNAYEQDLPNLRTRSNQSEHLSDESRQSIGYWPSANDGVGNRNPVVDIGDDQGLEILYQTPQPGTTVKLDASQTYDPDEDRLKFNWWVLTAAGTYNQPVKIEGGDTHTATIHIPADSAGKSFHLICEVTDDGTHNLTGYRRIVFEPAK